MYECHDVRNRTGMFFYNHPVFQRAENEYRSSFPKDSVVNNLQQRFYIFYTSFFRPPSVLFTKDKSQVPSQAAHWSGKEYKFFLYIYFYSTRVFNTTIRTSHLCFQFHFHFARDYSPSIRLARTKISYDDRRAVVTVCVSKTPQRPP